LEEVRCEDYPEKQGIGVRIIDFWEYSRIWGSRRRTPCVLLLLQVEGSFGSFSSSRFEDFCRNLLFIEVLMNLSDSIEPFGF